MFRFVSFLLCVQALLYVTPVRCAEEEFSLSHLPPSFTMEKQLHRWGLDRLVTFKIKHNDTVLGRVQLESTTQTEKIPDSKREKVLQIITTLPRFFLLENSDNENFPHSTPMVPDCPFMRPSLGILNWRAEKPTLNGYGKGSIEADLTYFYPSFRIFSKENILLATGSMNFWNSECTVKSATDNHVLAVITSPIFRLTDYWNISIKDPAAFSEKATSPYMLVLLAAFQSEIPAFRQVESSRQSTRAKLNKSIDEFLSRHLQNQPHLPTHDACVQKVRMYRKRYSKTKPHGKDLAFIKKLPSRYGVGNIEYMTKHQFYTYVKKLIELLESKRLNKKQKKALVIYLDHALKNVKQ